MLHFVEFYLFKRLLVVITPWKKRCHTKQASVSL